MINNSYRYILEPYTGNKSRYTCPACGAKGQFVRYVDTHQNNRYIADNVGRCNRADNCRHEYTPKQFFAENGKEPVKVRKWIKPTPAVLQQNVPNEYVLQTGSGIEINNFVKFLATTFGTAKTNELVKLYHIGTIHKAGSYYGATVFWQIRTNGSIAYGKVMQYDPATGKRVKDSHAITTVWNALHLPKIEHYEQCLFGEHLLKLYPKKPVYIHESEKTAIIASVCYPQYIHLACGGSTQLNTTKCKALLHRTGCLLPDIGKYAEWCGRWEKICNKLPRLRNFIVADTLEKLNETGALKDGEDLADYILTHLHEYKPPQPLNEPVTVNIETDSINIPLTAKEPVTQACNTPEIKERVKTSPATVQPDTWDTNLNEALYSFGIEQVQATAPTAIITQTGDAIIDNDLIYSSTPNVPIQVDMWQVQNLTAFFDTVELPPALPSLKIIDLPLYVSGNLGAVTRYNGFRTFEPYLNRLLQVKAILTDSTYVPNTLPCK